MADEDYKQQYEIITSTLRVVAILRPLLEKHALLTATLPNSNQFFTTALLKINADTSSLFIDELHPQKGHHLLLKASRITLRTQLGGVDVNFSMALKNTGTENGIAYYELSFPENIRYRQRRSSYRVPVSSATSIPVNLITADDNSFDGELHDISAGGMCIRLPKKKAEPFANNTDEIKCTILLPDKSHIKCLFKICHSQLHEPSNNFHIGGNFLQLETAQHRAIERFVIELQRRSRQKVSR
jgi:c-di-GMP-binding flagellar brake protein YcgR